jgi:hypothetical protein
MADDHDRAGNAAGSDLVLDDGGDRGEGRRNRSRVRFCRRRRRGRQLRQQDRQDCRYSPSPSAA